MKWGEFEEIKLFNQRKKIIELIELYINKFMEI
jgi:hypothetical protein